MNFDPRMFTTKMEFIFSRIFIRRIIFTTYCSFSTNHSYEIPVINFLTVCATLCPLSLFRRRLFCIHKPNGFKIVRSDTRSAIKQWQRSRFHETMLYGKIGTGENQ